jgi:hypothetical protein
MALLISAGVVLIMVVVS